VLVEVKARTVVQVLAIVLAALALIELLSAARDVLILLGISLFLAVALNPAVVLVQRWLPRGLAVAALLGSGLAGLVLAVARDAGALARPGAVARGAGPQPSPLPLPDPPRRGLSRAIMVPAPAGSQACRNLAR